MQAGCADLTAVIARHKPNSTPNQAPPSHPRTGLRTNTHLTATLCPQQAPSRESSMLPSTSTPATPRNMGTQPRVCCGHHRCSAELLQLQTSLQLNAHRLPPYWGFLGLKKGKKSFKCETSMEIVFPGSQFTTSVAECSCAPSPSWKPGFSEDTPELCCLSFAVLVRNHISC